MLVIHTVIHTVHVHTDLDCTILGVQTLPIYTCTVYTQCTCLLRVGKFCF